MKLLYLCLKSRNPSLIRELAHLKLRHLALEFTYLLLVLRQKYDGFRIWRLERHVANLKKTHFIADATGNGDESLHQLQQ